MNWRNCCKERTDPREMGHPGSVSRLVCGVKRDRKLEKRVNELGKLLQRAD